MIADIWKNGGPIYEADPVNPVIIIECNADGSKRRGRMENGKFVQFGIKRIEPIKPSAKVRKLVKRLGRAVDRIE